MKYVTIKFICRRCVFCWSRRSWLFFLIWPVPFFVIMTRSKVNWKPKWSFFSTISRRKSSFVSSRHHRRPGSFLRKLKDILISLSEQVVKTTRDELAKHERAKVIIDNEQNIKDAIRAIGEHHVIEHAVFKLLCESMNESIVPFSSIVLVQRYIHFVHQLLDHPAGAGSSLSNVAIPNGLNLVMNEVITTVSLFLRLITYNKLVFHEHYDRILLTLTRE